MSDFRLPLYLALTMLASGPAAFAQEQETVYVGSSGQLAVEVDLDSLDAPYEPPIGAASSVGLSFGNSFRGPELLMPNSLTVPGEPVMLTPPGSMKTAEKKKTAPKPSPKRTGLTRLKPPKAAPTPPPVEKAEMAPPRAPEPPPPAYIEEVAEAEDVIEAEEVVEAEEIVAPEPPPPAPEIEEIEVVEEPVAPPPVVETVEAIEETVTEEVAVAEPAPPPPPPAEAFVEELDSAETMKAPPPPPTEIEEMTEETTIVEDSMAPVPMAPPPLPVIEDVVEETAQTEIATLPPATAIGAAPPSGPVMIVFEQDSAVLNDSAKIQIRLIEQNLTANDGLRLQLVAFATGSEDNPSRARRLSLSRALAIRSFLVENGVKSTRMDVRALGNKIEGSPGDRVDLVLIEK